MKSLKNYFCARNLFIGGIILLVIFFFTGILMGSSRVTLNEFIGMLKGDNSTLKNIFLYVRLPRVMAALFAGAGLAASGAVLQSVLANRLASPGIIGVNAGAGLGVSIYSLTGLASGIALSLFAFGGSFVAVWLVTLAAMKTRASKSTVILGGVAVNAVFNAISEGISVLNPDSAMLSAEFKVGGFSSVTYLNLIPGIILISVGIIILFTILNELDLLSLGDETAKSLGLNVKAMRIVFLSIAALVAGVSVSFSGLLGFVGLIIPNLIRMVVGSESKRLIPLSVLYGGVFVLICDTLARIIFAPYELPVGIIMAITGGPFFVLILLKKGVRS